MRLKIVRLTVLRLPLNMSRFGWAAVLLNLAFDSDAFVVDEWKALVTDSR